MTYIQCRIQALLLFWSSVCLISNSQLPTFARSPVLGQLALKGLGLLAHLAKTLRHLLFEFNLGLCTLDAVGEVNIHDLLVYLLLNLVGALERLAVDDIDQLGLDESAKDRVELCFALDHELGLLVVQPCVFVVGEVDLCLVGGYQVGDSGLSEEQEILHDVAAGGAVAVVYHLEDLAGAHEVVGGFMVYRVLGLARVGIDGIKEEVVLLEDAEAILDLAGVEFGELGDEADRELSSLKKGRIYSRGELAVELVDHESAELCLLFDL